jgi:hypothetical protein
MANKEANPCEGCTILNKLLKGKDKGNVTEIDLALAGFCEAGKAYFPDDQHRCTKFLPRIGSPEDSFQES